MPNSKLLNQIADKEIKKELIAAKVIKKPDLLTHIFEGLNAEDAATKYGCDKVLRIISELQPSMLYPMYDFFACKLESENNFFKWSAINIIANLACVDNDQKFEAIFQKYFASVTGPVMITAGNIVNGAAKIALANPHLTKRITDELLKVEKAKYQTDECRNIVLGQTIKSFDIFLDLIQDKEPVIKLIRKQLKNSRNATRKKAEEFLKKHKRITKEENELVL